MPIEPAKKQLFDCVASLADRATELDYKALAVMLHTVAGVVQNGCEDEFATLCSTYIEAKLMAELEKSMKEALNHIQKHSTPKEKENKNDSGSK